MQSKNLLLVMVVIAAMGALPSPAAAQGICTTNEYGDGNWTVEITQGPCAVSCDADGDTNPFCDPSGLCTGIEYTVTENGKYNSDHVATVIDDDAVVLFPDGPDNVYAACVGDSTMGLGEYECHEIAVRLNDDASTNQFRVVVEGAAGTVETSVVVRAGSRRESCKISGLGTGTQAASVSCVPTCGNFDEFQARTKREVLCVKECCVAFERDIFTGDIISFGPSQECEPTATDPTIGDGCCDVSVGCCDGRWGCDEIEGDPDCCVFDGEHTGKYWEICDAFQADVEDLELVVDSAALPNGNGAKAFDGTPISLGRGQFGDGYLSTGDNSCFTYVWGGVVYHWGSPCPDYQSR